MRVAYYSPKEIYKDAVKCVNLPWVILSKEHEEPFIIGLVENGSLLTKIVFDGFDATIHRNSKYLPKNNVMKIASMIQNYPFNQLLLNCL